MASSQPRITSTATAGSNRAGATSTSGRRRQFSTSKSTPNLFSMSPDSSPDVIVDETTPIQSRTRWSPSKTSGLHTEYSPQTSDLESAPTQRTQAPRSRSSSSSSTESSASSSSSSSARSQSPARPSIARSTTSNTSSRSHLPPRTKSYASLPRSLSSIHLTNFAPPFYNRPPTPLPPSPSLTSLLRPTFSAAPSRPTTPDDSDTETQHSRRHSTTTPSLAGLSTTTTGTGTATDPTQTHLQNTARSAQPLPRASPKVPTYEYYGFVLYLTSSLFFLGYVLWSYLPSPFLHQLGIYYYPDRWWSLALPAWIVMAVGFVYVGLAGYNIEVLTLPLGSLGAVVDEVGVVAVVDERTGKLMGRGRQGDVVQASPENWEGREWRWRDCWSEGTDAVLDVPIGGVCEILYGDS